MKKEDLKNIKLFVLDMDGTIYLSDTLIEGSLDFINYLKENDINFIFFTNNSSKTRDFYVKKLNKMGFDVTKDNIMTSADVTMEYLDKYYQDKKIYIVATDDVKQSFVDFGINAVEDNPDAVLLTFDTTLTYEKLDKACAFIRNGADFIATHLDINCPTKDGFMPDCGSMCALIEKSTEVSPKYLGKPFKETSDMILRRTGFKKEETAFIGDRLYTDIKCAVNNGITGILVLSGESKISDIEKYGVTPSLIFDKAYDMIKYLK